jgi:hypothetical protein
MRTCEDEKMTECLHRTRDVRKGECCQPAVLSDKDCIACLGRGRGKRVAFLQKLAAWGVEVPKDEYYWDFFVSMMKSKISEKGETWVKENPRWATAGWSYLETLL